MGIEQGQDYWAVERLTQATADTYKSLGSRTSDQKKLMRAPQNGRELKSWAAWKLRKK